MFYGEYTHSLDDKKRLSVPASFRRILGKKVVLAYGLNKCLSVYPLKEWNVVAKRLAQLSSGKADERAFSRFMLSGAREAEVDAIGRVIVPENLKQYAALGEKVVFAGRYSHVEIWNEESWKSYIADITVNADTVAEKLGENGVF
jgi:MraZ protein